MDAKEGKELNRGQNPAPHKRNYRKPVRQNGTGKAPAKKNGGEQKSAYRNPSRGSSNKRENKRTPVRIIPLGGLNEIGKNMTVFEC